MIGYIALRISRFSGKIACPLDGVATSMKVIDGSELQLSEVLQKEEAASRRQQQNDMDTTRLALTLGIQSPFDANGSDFGRLVQQFMDEKERLLPTTLRGEPSFGAPKAGGITAFESQTLVASLEELQRANYGCRRMPTWCKQGLFSVDTSTIFAVAGARADEQRNGEHLIRSTKSRTVSSLANEGECAAFSAFLASNTDFQDAVDDLEKVSQKALADFWDEFVTFTSRGATRKAGARAQRSPMAKRNRDGGSFQRTELLSFFKEMLRLTFLGDSHMKKTPARGRGRDYGILGSFCTCGLSIPQSRQVLNEKEHAAHWLDAAFGALNHWTNALLGDYCCPSMLAGHLIQRLPAASDRVGGAQRMGGVWNTSQQEQWDCPAEDVRKVDARWLNSFDLTKQSCPPGAKLTCLLDPAVNSLLAAPSLHSANPISGRDSMYLLLDELHSHMTSHARGPCGNNRRSNLRFNRQHRVLDDAAAERHWSQQKAKANLYGLPPGTKLWLQHLQDDHASFLKVYDDGDLGGVLIDMCCDCDGKRVVAYDSLQRFRYVCGECGIAYGSCLHTGDRPGWDDVFEGVWGSSLPSTALRQGQCPMLMQALGLACCLVPSSLPGVPGPGSSTAGAGVGAATVAAAGEAAAAAAAGAPSPSLGAIASGGSRMCGDGGTQGGGVGSSGLDGSGVGSNSGVQRSQVQDDLRFLTNPSAFPEEQGGRARQILSYYRIPRGQIRDMLAQAKVFLGRLVSCGYRSMPLAVQSFAPVLWLQLVNDIGIALRPRIATLSIQPSGSRLPVEFSTHNGRSECVIVESCGGSFRLLDAAGSQCLRVFSHSELQTLTFRFPSAEAVASYLLLMLPRGEGDSRGEGGNGYREGGEGCTTQTGDGVADGGGFGVGDRGGREGAGEADSGNGGDRDEGEEGGNEGGDGAGDDNRAGDGAAREGDGACDSDSSSSSSSSISAYLAQLSASGRSAKSQKSFDVRRDGPAPSPLVPCLPDAIWDLILGSTDSQVTQQTSTNRKVVEFLMMKAHRHILRSYTTWDEMTRCQQDSFLIGDCPIMTHWDAHPPPHHVQVCVCHSSATISRLGLVDPRSPPLLARSGLQERIGAEFGFTHLCNLRHEDGEIRDGDIDPPLLQSIPNSGAFLTRLKADSSELAATILYAWECGGAKERVLKTEFGCPTSQSLLDQISSFLMYNAHEKSMAAQFTFGIPSRRPAELLRHFFYLAQWSICFSIPSLTRYSHLTRRLSEHRERHKTKPSWYSPVLWETSKLATKVREKLALEWTARQCSAEYGEEFFLWRGWPSCEGRCACHDDQSFWSCQPKTVLVRQVPASCSRAP